MTLLFFKKDENQRYNLTDSFSDLPKVKLNKKTFTTVLKP